MDPAFATMQQAFVDEWCGEFDEADENKLIYTDIFLRFTELVERHLSGWLQERVPGFQMVTFMEMLANRQDEVVGDVFDMLTALGDFDEFKSMMLAHRVGRNRGLAEVEAVGWRGMGPGEAQKARTGGETPASVAGPKFSVAIGRVHGRQSKA